MENLFSFSALNCVYASVALISFLFAVVSLIGAEAGDFFDFSSDIDVDVDGGFDLTSISPFAMAMFGATFGLVGLLTSIWLEMEALPSIIAATVSGLIIGAIAQVLFIYVFSPSKSSHYSLQQDAVGREVEVTTTIPADGLGQVAYNNVSGRVTLGARSSEGTEIAVGKLVIVERIVGRVAQVKPVGD